MVGESSQPGPGAGSLRQSSRTKRPSRRAEEMQHADAVETMNSRKRQKGGQAVAKKGQKKGASVDEKEQAHDDDGGEYEEGSEDDDEGEGDEEGDEEEDKGEDERSPAKEQSTESGEEIFCVCRKGDDGRPMVFCAECNDWFHFKCVNLTKKVAERLSEYICPACGEKTGKQSKTLDDAGEKEEEGAQEVGPRRASQSTKRKASEDEGARKRSRSSPQSPSTRKPSSASLTGSRPAPSEQQGRRSSGSQNIIAAPTGSTAVVKARSETLRKHAVEQLVGTFDLIFSDHQPSKGEQTEGEEEEKGGASRGRRYAVAFESSLFDLHSEGIAKTTIRTAGKMYRDRLRTFLFNLKDKGNTTLRQKIASEELAASELAGMSNEELANDEIRKEVERRKRENLEQSILKKEQAPLRKLTHKGEIDIEYEAAQSSRMAEEREREHKEGELKREAAHQHQAKSSREENESSPDREGVAASPTASHSLPSQASPPAPSSEQRIASSLQSPTVSFDFANVWAGEMPRSEGDEKGDEEEGEGAGEGEGEGEGEEDGKQADAKANTGGGEAAEERADNFIDDFLGMPEGSEADKGEKSKTAEDDEVGDKDGEVKWRGAISMPDEGVFTGKVRQVAGRPLLDQEWASLFASAHSVIEGRLPSSSAAPYLVQSRVAFRTELVVMTLEPSWEPESIQLVPGGDSMTKEENRQSFDRLMTYFQRRDRYGVLPSHPSARGRFVKDFYIAALPKDANVPHWLELMQAPEFQGEAVHGRSSDIFLLVAVLFKQNPRRDEHLSQPVSSGFSPPGTTSGSATATPQHGGMSPPAPHLSGILGGPGSTTLQDLLKAVGGNKSPATPLTAGNQSPNTLVQQATSMSTTHPSIESLSEMPKPQLEDMLHKNPNLVDQLLKTLGGARPAGSTTPPSAPPRPPGPPPPPPLRVMQQQQQQQQHQQRPPPPMRMPTSGPPQFGPSGYASPPMPAGPHPTYDYNHPQHHHPAQHQLPQHQPPQQYPLHHQHQPPPHALGGYPPADQAWRPDNGYPQRPPPYAGPPSGPYGGLRQPPIRGGHRGGPPPGRRRF